MAAPRERLRAAVPAVAVVAATALIVTGAVIAPGYDVQEAERVESGVWVTRASGEYARIDTDLAQIDTVRQVADPSGVAQFGSAGIVLGQGDRQFWPIDSALPADLVVAGVGAGRARIPTLTSQPSPPGTRSLVSAGRWALFLTDVGDAFVGTVNPGRGENLVFEIIDPYAHIVVEEDEERPKYVSAAGTVSAEGIVALYSALDEEVRLFDVRERDRQIAVHALRSTPNPGDAIQMAFVGDRWVMYSAGLLWVQGRGDPIEVDAASDARLQESTPTGQLALIADSTGLYEVNLSNGEIVRPVEVSGSPAAPVEAGGVRYAAWLSETAGWLWASDADEVIELTVDAEALADASFIDPMLRSNGDRAVLNEVTTGLLWLVPSGRVIPIAQWNVSLDSAHSQEEVTVEDASQQLPPTAEPDVFGVRSGALTALPLLYNDHDPNRADVLSIVPESMAAGLSDPIFGELALVAQNQTATVQVNASRGSATFSYSVTDGISTSAPATVTLTIVPDDVNTAPVWCGVPDCKQRWPSPSVAAGGSASVQVLDGWVDPEGDPFVLTDVVLQDPGLPILVIPTADGRVAISHLDPNAGAQTVLATVIVTDSRGASATRELAIQVSSAPRLDMRSITVATQVGVPAEVDVLSAVEGGSGSYRVLDAVDSSSRGGVLQVTPSLGDSFVRVLASEPGEYTATITVQDTLTLAERTGILRVSAANAPQPLSTAPMTAFVRPGEDVTVAVLGAVTNTSGRVLIVGSAEANTPLLSASVVGQTYVRVSGSTEDGMPGPIGTVSYTVTDGAGNWTQGVISVFLVEPSRDVTPIAVPDAVAVRAGGQVDIPVLENDISPRGQRLALHPELVASGASGELAFVSGSLVRYLAPSTPGVYSLSYSTYAEASPERLSTAAITVTVLEEGANRAPLPRALTARVLGGRTVDIAVDTAGIDPDGDSVRLISVGQPGRGLGSAVIAADGRTIVYRAPEGGVPGGQVTFDYTVRDARGATGTGTVRVGVLLDAIGDVTPVTFNDALRVQVGTATPLTVRPLANDRDPSQGALKLVALQPNVPPNDPDYERLSALIDNATDLDAGIVLLRAGSITGVNSYIYTVESQASQSTAQGLILVTVADSAAPDRPLVADTVVDLDTRHRLASGLDVVRDRVTWITGDVSSLQLSLWDESAPYTVSGQSISGAAPAGGAVVPFELSGVGSDGEPVSSFGFLVIPPFDDMRVQLAAGASAVRVDEGAAERFDLRELVAVDARDTLELAVGVDYHAQRAEAQCELIGDTRVLYQAGYGAPWSDTCSVVMRVRGQETWSVVPVPVTVLPVEPQPVLSSITRTINPGQSETIDLENSLTSWRGGKVGDTSLLDFSVTYAGGSFEVIHDGTSLSIAALAGARAGVQESIGITVSNFGGLQAKITVIVGVAPPDSPRGATVNAQCAVTGPDCTITVVGVEGEYDPFAGRPGGGLTLVDAAGSTGCSVATVQVANASQLRASWPSAAKPLGGTCSFSFTVQDAQGRQGLGVLELDVQGFPANPATVVTTAYTGTSVTLRVALGQAANAHPALTAVTLWEGSDPVGSCAPAGPTEYTCQVTGLVNGEPHVYTARAMNAIGESDSTTPHETWAYQAPVIGALSGTPEYDAAITSLTDGLVRLSITGADDIASYRVINTAQTVTRTGNVTTAEIVLQAGGPVLIEVVPISRFSPPIGSGSEGSVRTTTVGVAGLPSFSFVLNGAGNEDGTAITVSGPVLNTNGSVFPQTLRTVASQDASGNCYMDGSRKAAFTGGMNTVSATGMTVSGLTPNTLYYVTLCGSNGFGAAQLGPIAVGTYKTPPAPVEVSGYAVQSVPNQPGDQRTWPLYMGPVFEDLDPEYSDYTLEYRLYGVWTSTFALTFGLAPTTSPPLARWCLALGDGNKHCSETSPISYVTAPTMMSASLLHCGWPRSASAISVSGSSGPHYQITWTAAGGTEPTRNWIYRLTWFGDYAGLSDGVWYCVEGYGLP